MKSSEERKHQRTEFIVETKNGKMFHFVYQNSGDWPRNKDVFSRNLSHESFLNDYVQIEIGKVVGTVKTGKIIAISKSLAHQKVFGGKWHVELKRTFGDFGELASQGCIPYCI